MDESERKYEILPGVKLPDFKTLKEASSDFSETGVEDIDIRNVLSTGDRPELRRASLEEIQRLRELGDEVAEKEERDAEESRRRMQAIMNSAVTQSASIDDLRKTAASIASEEKLAEMEQRKKEEDERQAQEDEKKRMREERRAMQRKQLEDAKAKKNSANSADDIPEEELSVVEAEADTEEPDVSQDPVVAEEKTVEQAVEAEAEVVESPASAEVIEPEIDIDSTGVISSDEEAFEDFGEFLDDGNK